MTKEREDAVADALLLIMTRLRDIEGPGAENIKHLGLMSSAAYIILLHAGTHLIRKSDKMTAANMAQTILLSAIVGASSGLNPYETSSTELIDQANQLVN